MLGICGGGGYALKAADKRFKAVATLSMFNSGLGRRNGLYDQSAYAGAPNAKNKELFLIDGATHIETY